MKRLSWAVLAASVVFAKEEIPPKGMQVVEFSHGWNVVYISSGDVNRIVCEKGDASTVVYSQEKEMQVKTEGRNVFVKLVPKEEGNGKKVISDFPRELYVECAGEVFQLLLYPKSIPAATIYLKLPYQKDTTKAKAFEKASPFEETIGKLIRAAYLEEIPDGYDVEIVNKSAGSFRELDLVLYKRYTGDRLVVEEYLITAKLNLELSEASFLPYLKNPVAISIVKPILKEGETTRMFVVSISPRD
jgi:conjugal transfer pilus assembly protein TraK